MRCELCKSGNPPGVLHCENCGAKLPGIICAQCYEENPTDNNFCGRCGQPLTGTDEIIPPTGRVYENIPTSIVSIIVFGAFLAVISLIYPWYVLGDESAAEDVPVSLIYQMASGWDWFPGMPLIITMTSVLLATALAILAHRGKIHPAPSLLVGLISLLSTIWLWQGLVTGEANPQEWEIAPMLATIGTILVLVGGSMAARPLLQR